jgi:hypothetical protein
VTDTCSWPCRPARSRTPTCPSCSSCAATRPKPSRAVDREPCVGRRPAPTDPGTGARTGTSPSSLTSQTRPTSRSPRTTLTSWPAGPAAPEASTATRPAQPSGPPTARPASSWSWTTNDTSLPTGASPWSCSADASNRTTPPPNAPPEPLGGRSTTDSSAATRPASNNPDAGCRSPGVSCRG